MVWKYSKVVILDSYCRSSSTSRRRNVAAVLGLVTVAAQDVATAVADLTAAIALGSPQGLAESKALTTAATLEEFDRRAEELTQRSAARFVSDEAREGMLAFLEKRPPRWVG